LQSQKVIYPPLIIGTVGTVVHYCVAKYFIYELGFGATGAAWAKNISDSFNALAIYLFIIKEQPTK
jgi:Na+-driven multidrug efflux pump